MVGSTLCRPPFFRPESGSSCVPAILGLPVLAVVGASVTEDLDRLQATLAAVLPAGTDLNLLVGAWSMTGTHPERHQGTTPAPGFRKLAPRRTMTGGAPARGMWFS